MSSIQGHSELPENRDIFLSHRSHNKDFVRKLSADIEKTFFQGRQLLTWVDEAEIRPGQSIVGMVNYGLEKSRFCGILMTPEYFTSESGWTDAEWHAALGNDPDNRKGNIIPILVKDCPYIPFLLRHLKMIDMRGKRYKQGLSELLMILRDEPLPRPSVYRGQLINPSGMISRQTLYQERSIIEGDPDVVKENLHCNLIPFERLPQNIYSAPILKSLYKSKNNGNFKLPMKDDIKENIRNAQKEAGVEIPRIPAFRMSEGKIITFHDLEDPEGLFASIVNNREIHIEQTLNWILDEDDRKILVSLLNMSISRHLLSSGLVRDNERQDRFYFPPTNKGTTNIITWKPNKRRADREVAGPRSNAKGDIVFWRHLAAFIKIVFLANSFFLQIKPTWVFTDDGYKIKRGPQLTRLVNRWTIPERNIHILYHVRFWRNILKRGSGSILIRAGDQLLELSNNFASIELPFGISDDQRDLMNLLDQEVTRIERAENAWMEFATEEIELEESPFEEEIEDTNGQSVMEDEGKEE